MPANDSIRSGLLLLKAILFTLVKCLHSLILLPVVQRLLLATLFSLSLLSQAGSLPVDPLLNELAPKESAPLGVQIIRIPYTQTENPDGVEFYYRQVLLLALDKTRASDGNYELVYSNTSYSVDRSKQLIVDGGSVDLMWASRTAERETFMRSIPVDLLQGLNNYRVLFVNPQDQKNYYAIRTLNEFKRFTAGGGYGWTSSEMLRANNINVINAPQYDSLFKMLVAKRFDYVSRGFHDVYNDFIFFQENGFNIETQKDIVLRYETPIMYCFFVNKNNKGLADRIYRGLSIAEADGSFEALRLTTPFFVAAKNELNKKRREIVLTVPVAVK